MRNPLKTIALGAALGSLLGLVSCGGIDGSGYRPPIQVSASGPINGFGSVIVNGVHYDTDNANIYIRGELSDEVDLDVGDYVVVVGEVDSEGNGVATEVHYQPRVTGLIEEVDVVFNRLTVMGQTIQLMEDTTYSSDIMPRNIEGFSVGRKVTVSGIADADNVIRATRIEISNSSAFEVLGSIELIDLQSSVFHIDGVKVDYSDISYVEPQIEEGRLVIVSGDVLADNTLTATKVDFNLDYRKLREVESVEFTGFVRNFDGQTFDIDTLPVSITDSTQFNEGESLSNLSDNTKVKVEGTFGDGDKLAASYIEIIPDTDMQVYGTLQSLVPASWGSPFWGTVQVQDHIFWVKFDTKLVGEHEERIGFMDLRVGDSVYVSGYAGKYGNLYASSIAVDNRQYENLTYDIQGFVYAPVAEQHSFSIFNTRVVTNADTIFMDGANSLSEAVFYERLTNQYLLVRGYFDFTHWAMVATRVSFVYPWVPPPVEAE